MSEAGFAVERQGQSQAGYRFWALCYSLLFLALIHPFWLNGEVIAPHRGHSEIAVTPQGKTERIENLKFSDFSRVYIPELTMHHQGASAGWLSLWSDQNEFGRPLYHLAGFSPAYPPTWVLGQLTQDPYRLLTILTLSTCFLGGLFMLFWCREEGLSPLSGFLAACILATSPLFMYWLSFPMFPAIWCWAACIGWAIARLARKSDLLGWTALALATHSILLTAYPQGVVYQAYLLGGYSIVLALRRFRTEGRAGATRFLCALVTATGLGVLLALPVYADLVHTASQSARMATDISFFTHVLPRIDSFETATRLAALGTMPELLGNPISPSFPLPYDGLSVTLPVILLAFVAFRTRLSACWGWWLAAGMLLVLAIFHGLFEIAVKYLGFHLSRSSPLGSLILPLTLIAAYGADAVLRRSSSVRWRTLIRSACLVALGIQLFVAIFAVARGIDIAWPVLAASLGMTALFAAQMDRTRPLALVAMVVLSTITVSRPLMLHQPLDEIAQDSPLLQAVRANLSADARYAVASPKFRALPPNRNAAHGIASVHSYNSLSPRSYQQHIESLGGKTRTYGRMNLSIDPDIQSTAFWMSNIELLLAAEPIEKPGLTALQQVDGIHLYRVKERMGCCIQVSLPQTSIVDGQISIERAELLDAWHGKPVKTADDGDRLIIDVASREGSQTLLILSRKYHRNWWASAATPDGPVDAGTLRVNGFFQGVVLPPGSTRLTLEFAAFARWSWSGHIVWLCALLALAGLGSRKWARMVSSNRKEIKACLPSGSPSTGRI